MSEENKKLSDLAKAKQNEKQSPRPYDENFCQEMREKVIKSRVKLLFDQPFYGQLLLNFKLIIVGDKNHWVKSCAIDGKNLYFNPEYVNMQSDEEIKFSIAHQLMHVVFHHITRRGSRDRTKFFEAGDYVINGILERDGIGKMPSKTMVDEDNTPKATEIKTLRDSQYDGKTTDEVYVMLMDDNGGGGSSFDQHIDAQDMNYDDDDILEIENNMDAAIQNAAAGAGAGKVPGEIQRWIDELSEPKLNWREFLHENAVSKIKSDYTWKRPNKRLQGAFPNLVFPSQKVEASIKFYLSIDMSGSISPDMAKDMLSEVAGIAGHFKEFEVMVWCFDTVVYKESVKTFTQENIHEIHEYVPSGGGGTDFDVNWEFMKKEKIVPDMFVMFTDGYPWQSWGDEDYCDTFFIIHDEGAIASKVKAPFGQTLYYSEH